MTISRQDGFDDVKLRGHLDFVEPPDGLPDLILCQPLVTLPVHASVEWMTGRCLRRSNVLRSHEAHTTHRW
jgi:hypothetical protein